MIKGNDLVIMVELLAHSKCRIRFTFIVIFKLKHEMKKIILISLISLVLL